MFKFACHAAETYDIYNYIASDAIEGHTLQSQSNMSYTAKQRHEFHTEIGMASLFTDT